MNRYLVRDLASYLPAKIVPAVMAFFSIPILTHFFSPTDYGNYVLVLGVVTVLSTFTGLFLMPIVRFYPSCEKAGRQNEFYNTGFTANLLLTLGLALGSVLALVLGRTLLSPGLGRLMWVGILLFVCHSVFSILPEFFRAQRRIILYSGLQIWRSMIGVGLALFLVLVFRVGIEGFLWGMILSMALVFPFALKPAMNRSSIAPTRVSWALGGEMMRFGLPLVVGNLFARVIYLSDRYVLGIFRSSQEVGIYSANYDIADHTVMLIAILFQLSSGSIAFHIWEKEGERKSREFVSVLTRYYLMIGLPAVVGLSVLAKPLIRIMTSSEYWAGARIIPVVVLGAFIYGLQQRFQVGLHFHKKTQLIMRLVVAAGLLNLGLNLLLIPRYGYMAAAFITLLSYILLLALMAFFSRRYFVWEFPLGSLLRILAASVFMGGVILTLNLVLPGAGLLALLSSVGLGIITYILGLFILNEINPAEKKAVFAFLTRISERLFKKRN